jgi:hypothetical protein
MVHDDYGAEPEGHRSNALDELVQASERAFRDSRCEVLVSFDKVEPLISWLRASMAEGDELELAAGVRETMNMLLDSFQPFRDAVKFWLIAEDAYRTTSKIRQELLRIWRSQGEADELQRD